MSRYREARLRVMRALGTDLPGLSPKKPERRPYPPGQHGQARKKPSEYALRLHEKQKLRLNYGLTEKQLRNLMQEARNSGTSAGLKLLELVERRLDNVVFRAGFARSIPAARQLVNHGHVLVDGRRLDIASYRIRSGQTVTLRESSKQLAIINAAKDVASAMLTPWLEVDHAERVAKVLTLPDVNSVPFPIQVQLVVEYYSQRL
jgi:small subunit ribosomal protein S4